ncbi:MAG: DNA replication and repair protein RecF [Candidatus Melainabacteria bacterium]|nr:DNA replication and repair protein RecF [Candidatus Melainabacteria bacterium]
MSGQPLGCYRVESLCLVNFRNIQQQTFAPGPGRNVLVGRNGHGKTNWLEALYYLSHARSLRTHDDKELVGLQNPSLGSRLQVTVNQENPAFGSERTKMEVRFLPQAPDFPEKGWRYKAQFRKNDSVLRSRSQSVGQLPTVSFFLPDLLLLRGTPADRRRWLDAALVQYDPLHFSVLAEFQRIHRQKSHCLREWYRAGSASTNTVLEVLNQQFAQASARLAMRRWAYLAQVQPLLGHIYPDLSDLQDGAPRITYSWQQLPVDGLDDLLNQNVDETTVFQPLADLYLRQLQAIQPEECRRGVCLLGPHRDDVLLWLNEHSATAYASQGQQRTLVLALKMAEWQLLTQKLKAQPILLLDDVMAELDPRRQACLLEHVGENGQVFLTTTHLDPDALSPFLSAEAVCHYQVERGLLQPLNPTALAYTQAYTQAHSQADNAHPSAGVAVSSGY